MTDPTVCLVQIWQCGNSGLVFTRSDWFLNWPIKTPKSITLIGAFLILIVIFGFVVAFIRQRAFKNELGKLKWVLDEDEIRLKQTPQGPEDISRRSAVLSILSQSSRRGRRSTFNISTEDENFSRGRDTLQTQTSVESGSGSTYRKHI